MAVSTDVAHHPPGMPAAAGPAMDPEGREACASSSGPVASLYVHVPFCAQKCGYCAFYSEASTGEMMNRYVGALIQELEMVAADLRPRTVFFGGGTPTLLNLRQWERIFAAMDRLGLCGGFGAGRKPSPLVRSDPFCPHEELCRLRSGARHGLGTSGGVCSSGGIMTSTTVNKAHALDGGIPFCFHIRRYRPAAAELLCWPLKSVTRYVSTKT